MFITAFAGAAGAWRWGSSLIECKSVDYEPVDRLMEQLGPGDLVVWEGWISSWEMARTRFQDFPTIQ
jgi:hypothetical protein